MSYIVPAAGEFSTGFGAVASAGQLSMLSQDVDRIVDEALQLPPDTRRTYLYHALERIRPGLYDWAIARTGELQASGIYYRTAVRQAITEGLSQHFGMSDADDDDDLGRAWRIGPWRKKKWIGRTRGMSEAEHTHILRKFNFAREKAVKFARRGFPVSQAIKMAVREEGLGLGYLQILAAAAPAVASAAGDMIKAKWGPKKKKPSAPPPAPAAPPLFPMRPSREPAKPAFYKNPLVWVGAAAVLGGGIFLMTRKRSPAKANPRRRRRR